MVNLSSRLTHHNTSPTERFAPEPINIFWESHWDLPAGYPPYHCLWLTINQPSYRHGCHAFMSEWKSMDSNWISMPHRVDPKDRMCSGIRCAGNVNFWKRIFANFKLAFHNFCPITDISPNCVSIYQTRCLHALLNVWNEHFFVEPWWWVIIDHDDR